MKIPSSDIKHLKKVQEELKSLVILVNRFSDYELIGGCDVSYRGDSGTGAFVVCDRRLKLVEHTIIKQRVEFPYIPGYLAFREIPFLIAAFNELKTKPDIILVDGQGIAHPRGFGVASHLGVLLDIPTIGAAKNKLFGRCEMPVLERGSYTLLRDPQNNVIGACLVTKDRTKPIFVSAGHMVDLEMSVRVVLESALSYKIPEPLRLAHMFSRCAE